MNVFVDAESIGRELAENPDEFIAAMGALSDIAAGMFMDDLNDAHSGRTEEVAIFLRRAADAMSGQA